VESSVVKAVIIEFIYDDNATDEAAVKAGNDVLVLTSLAVVP
jgi:hypothetical protein